MVTAVLSYGDYVKDMTIAIKFSRLVFNGMYYIEESLKKLEKLITYDKCNMQATIIGLLKSKKRENLKKIQEITKKIKEIKDTSKIHALLGDAHEHIKELKKQIKEINAKNLAIDEKINILENDCFYSAEETLRKHRKLLCNLGFTCKGSQYKEDNCSSVELYECQISDEELITRAEAMKLELEENLNKKIENIKKNYDENIR